MNTANVTNATDVTNVTNTTTNVTNTTDVSVINVTGVSDIEYMKSAAKQGKILYATNTTMRDIATVMEHPEFRQFFDKYFKTSDDAQCILQLLKAYENINRDDPYEKIYVLSEAFKNSNIRQKLVENFIEWRNSGNQDYSLNGKNKTTTNKQKKIKKGHSSVYNN